jgi:gliding motility-associated-like protein
VTVVYEVCNDASGTPICTTATVTITVLACPSAVDTDGDGLTDCEETTGVDDPSTTAVPVGTSDPNNPCDPNPLAVPGGDCDGDGNSNGTDPNPTVPTAADDSGTVAVGSTTTIDILGNDDYLDNADPTNGGTTTITQTGGTAGGTVTFDPTTGTLDYTPLPGEAGTVVTVVYEVCNDASGTPICTTATVTITVLACPSAVDTDGDGLTDCEETTGVDDPSTTGVPNGTSDPLDPCSDSSGVITDGDTSNPIFANADCDGDGVTNGDELNPPNGGTPTNPGDPCDYNVGDVSLPITAGVDCDNDGLNDSEEITGVDDPATPDNPNGNTTDPNNPDTDGDGVLDGTEGTNGTDPNDPCDFNVIDITEIPSGPFLDADCDGDGVPNGVEIDPDGDGNPGPNATDPNDPCDFNVEDQDLSTVSDEWLDLDCDGDDIDNGDELGDVNDNGIPDYIEFNNGNPNAEDGVEVFDIMTPGDGDGLNDVFVIRGLDKYPNNTVKIYNRWGVLVFETRGYGLNNNFFTGESNGRVTIEQSKQLPVGTYYYVLEYVNNSGSTVKKAGPLYINRR